MRSYKKIKTKKATQVGDYETVFRDKEQKLYQVFFSKLNTPVTFWLCVYLVLFFYLQKQLAYHFFYIEQEQLFLLNISYFSSVIMEPAGLVRLLTEFCVSYFIHPYCGALIISAWLTLIGMLTAGIIKRIASSANLFFLSLLPIVILLYLHFDTNYFYRGTMAYILMFLVMYGYFCISNLTIRVLYVSVFGALLFWWAGAVAFLFVVCVFLWELISHFSSAYGFIFPLLIVSGLAFWSVYASLIGDFRFVLLPDGYFTYQLRPGVDIYLLWILMFLLLIICRLMRRRNDVRGGRKYLEMLVQLIVVAGAFWFGIDKFANRNSETYKELDYYMRTEQWDKVIERCSGETDNYLYKCCLNVALAEKGELADKMFAFDQRGIQSIYVSWNRIPHVSVLLSDVYFSMGHIALAQRMAFEAFESISNTGGPRMLKRLIQTNLIFGAYHVAEKYLDLLEQTHYYKEWAREHRLFLWNDEAIENDSLLSIKRKCIPDSNSLAELQGLHIDLENIARQNPNHKASIEYAGASYLLTKELFFFEEFINKHYRSDVLPLLPDSYQEAILILAEQDSSYLEMYEISDLIIWRYGEFRRQYIANRNNTAILPDLLKKSFGGSYWYYYMFK